MDKTFFVQELEAHSGMLYRVAWTILRNDDACQDGMRKRRSSMGKARFSPGCALFPYLDYPHPN